MPEKTPPENPDTPRNPPPIKTFRIKSSKVSLWENHNEEGANWRTITLERLYKPEGEGSRWKSTNGFQISDIDDLIDVLHEVKRDQKGLEVEIIEETGMRIKKTIQG